MADTEALSKKKLEVHVAAIKHHDGPLLLPEGMSTQQGIEVLQRKAKYDAEDVAISEQIPAFPWDGAIALRQAIEEQFGLVMQTATPTWFGPIPPQIMNIECGPGKTVKVLWGRFSLPGVTGWIETGFDRNSDGRVVFQASGIVKHRDEAAIRKLFARTRELASQQSIYKGKAFNISFRDVDGDPRELPAIKFPRLGNFPVIFNHDLEAMIESCILTPIRLNDAVRGAKVPLKRVTLLAGPYGTGKTLTAAKVANVAEEYGWTFLYVTEVEELTEALRFARDYQPAVVFAEDIDRAAGTDRTDAVNALLNTIDGVDSKNGEIMVILTSNHAEQINEAMRRPGRIDLLLSVDPPDANAVTRLIELYGGDTLAVGEDLTGVGELLAGQIPATIREVVERSKLEAIRRAGGSDFDITAADLELFARALLKEQKMFRPAVKADPTVGEVLARDMAPHVNNSDDAKRTRKLLETVAEHFGIEK